MRDAVGLFPEIDCLEYDSEGVGQSFKTRRAPAQKQFIEQWVGRSTFSVVISQLRGRLYL